MSLLAETGEAKFLGGGTNLVDLMRENIEQPSRLVDVTRLPLADVEELHDGGLRIGAAMRNSHLAGHHLIRERNPVLSEAILNGASAQSRNMVTAAGNLMQRIRCYYFYDSAAHCNKRSPGSGCDAIGGFNRIHAIFGASQQCIATHPSDMRVALAALNSTINVRGTHGDRSIPVAEFHRLPGATPQIETNLQLGELITSVDFPAMPFARKSVYRKVRNRASYAFALISVAAALEVENGVVKEVRIALGGVAQKPSRASRAEENLKTAERATFERDSPMSWERIPSSCESATNQNEIRPKAPNSPAGTCWKPMCLAQRSLVGTTNRGRSVLSATANG